jgi:hypothetical protein
MVNIFPDSDVCSDMEQDIYFITSNMITNIKLRKRQLSAHDLEVPSNYVSLCSYMFCQHSKFRIERLSYVIQALDS